MDITEAVSRYQSANSEIRFINEQIETWNNGIERDRVRRDKLFLAKGAALEALKRFMTPEAFAEFTSEDKPVTP